MSSRVYLQVDCMEELLPNVYNNDVIIEKLSRNAERSNKDSGKCLNY